MTSGVSAKEQAVHSGRLDHCVVGDCLMLLALCDVVLCTVLCFTVYKLAAQC